ncbi:hypothetical protein GCM10022239_15110 [Leifsonia bigeumensis]|uniref:Low molecular weight protein antigen 6 PH domain-containing protein n=1 Tax=Leifsonella bigeumensis TaxID=433643 RepID=A0ABP7FKJ7_9MICO
MFHSRFNQVLAIAVWLFCCGAVAAVLVSGLGKSAEYLPLIAFGAFLAWAGLWRPAVGVADDAVTIVNVFSTVVVPWTALIQVETRYALTLVTPGGRYTATAAPAPGRLATALSRREMGRVESQTGGVGTMRPGDLPTTDSGAAAYLVRQRWEKLVAEERIELGVADSTPATRRWHWAVIAMSAALLVAAMVSLALG